LDRDSTAAPDGMDAAQAQAGGEIEFFKQSSGRPLYCSRIREPV
jgi:hypothetical protein